MKMKMIMMKHCVVVLLLYISVIPTTTTTSFVSLLFLITVGTNNTPIIVEGLYIPVVLSSSSSSKPSRSLIPSTTLLYESSQSFTSSSSSSSPAFQPSRNPLRIQQQQGAFKSIHNETDQSITISEQQQQPPPPPKVQRNLKSKLRRKNHRRQEQSSQQQQQQQQQHQQRAPLRPVLNSKKLQPQVVKELPHTVITRDNINDNNNSIDYSFHSSDDDHHHHHHHHHDDLHNPTMGVVEVSTVVEIPPMLHDITGRNHDRSFGSYLQQNLQTLIAVDPKTAHDTINHLRQIYYNNNNSNNSNSNDSNSTTTRIATRQQQQQQQPPPPPDFMTLYVTVMDGYIQLGKLYDAQSIVDQLEQEDFFATITTPIIVDQIYVRMTQAWADDYKDDFSASSAEQAEALLRRVMSIYTATTTTTTTTTTAVAAASGKCNTTNHSDMQHRQQQLNNRRSGGSKKREQCNTDLTSKRTTISNNAIVKIWTSVVDGWSKRSGIVQRAMTRADELLNEMETHELSFIRPNVLTYTSVICGLSRCKQRNDMARQAEDVLERMKRNKVQPDMVAYAAVINCWAKAVSRRERSIAANRAISLLNEMERLYVTKKVYNVKPSTLTYITVIAAIGNCLDPSATQLAEGIIERMRNLHESGTIVNVKPNTATYNAVIFALGRAPISKRYPTTHRAECLLDDMTQRAELGERDVQPDVRTWAFILRAWARSKQPNAAENAQRILDKMEYRYAKGLSPVRPNFVCYTTVMGAWGYSRSKNALDNMEQILKRMEDRYSETLEPDVRPNTVSYVTCIDAFVGRNEPDAAQRAQATVDRMMKLYAKGLGHVRPTRPVFDVLIQAWSRSKEKNAAQNAEKIFHWMENQFDQGGDILVRPNEITLCAVLNAWANQAEYGGAARALQIWEHTNSVATSGTATQRDRGFRSTIAMANIVIKAIARSKDPDAVIKAERVLIQLEEDYRSSKSYVRPDVTTYSSVINACAYCVGNAAKRSAAFQVALRTFYKLYNMDDEAANNITYGTMFKAIQNLMPISEERIELARQLFDMCCEDGCVDYFVLSQVRFASPQLYRDLVEGPCGLGGPGLKYGLDAVLKNIPTEWTANTLDYGQS